MDAENLLEWSRKMWPKRDAFTKHIIFFRLPKECLPFF